MKHTVLIIFLLLTISIVKGQIGIDTTKQSIFIPNPNYVFSNDTSWCGLVKVGDIIYKNKLGIYQTGIIATILQQWHDYQKECYADSSLHNYNMYIINGEKYYTPISKNDFDLGFDRNYKGQEKIWEHKNPNNLTEFMSYLENKLNGGKK